MNAVDVKRGLYTAAQDEALRGEREAALAAWHSGEDPAEEWAEFLDFFALEWVDAQGFTLLERRWGRPLPAPLLAWHLELRHGLYVVDDQADGVLELRDLLTEEPLRARLADPLPRRSVLRSRLLPGPDGIWSLSGEPDLYDPMSAMARIDLAQRWMEDPRRSLSARLAELRRAFTTQAEQHAAFLERFGTDELVLADDEALRQALDQLLEHLTFTHRAPSRGGRTLAELHQTRRGGPPLTPRAELGTNLQGRGRVGLVYDREEGLHLLPWYGEFIEHVRGHRPWPQVLQFYLEDPGITALPFRRHAPDTLLAELLGAPHAERALLLAQLRPPRRQAPSILPLDEP